MLDHFRRLLVVALLAGLMAGGVATLGHQLGPVPTIVAAEAYEAPAEGAHGHDHGHAPGAAAAPHDHGEGAWTPSDGLERTLYTTLADLLTGVAYALMLAALLSLRGAATGWRQGLLWGLAGFACFTLAPGLGLPPELPGAPVAPVSDRQAWWLATAAMTGAGLWLIALTRRLPLALAGIALLLLPHLVGAPLPPPEVSAVPEALTQRFVAQTAAVSLLFWAVLGMAVGWLLGRGAESSPAGRPLA